MIIDAHCDALVKLWRKKLNFHDSPELKVNYEKWKKSPVKVQCFAVFVPDNVPEESQYSAALEMIDIFYRQIIEPYPEIKVIKKRQDIKKLRPHEKGAILTLEGCHAIGSDITKLKTLIRLGVRIVGLTWNQANAVCDGIGEKRGAGLSSFGEEVVEYLNQEKIWTDLSHISYKGFWDAISISRYPMASHSNVYQIAPHRRNLHDEQIAALIDRRGWIGVTFVPEFINLTHRAALTELIPHIEYMIRMGGAAHIGFGSDFDGIEDIVEGLYDVTEFDNIIKILCHRQTDNLVKRLSYGNFIDKFPQ
ncbi:membrane dipeptidase [Thalassobacillus pellis]|uniref:membrane dipeptidase n=1 Tax=Thalassobacillus pellis TaxID=748008 RepID=UPI00195FD1B8|nr:membrane dipeptidase [Thalassobacillus pellis]